MRLWPLQEPPTASVSHHCVGDAPNATDGCDHGSTRDEIRLQPRRPGIAPSDKGLIESSSDRVAPINQKTQALSQQRRVRRLARYEEVKQLKQRGLPIKQIAQQLGAHRRTIRNFLRAESFPERQAPKPRTTLMDPFAEYLKKRWEDGCHNGAQLYREIREQGYKGSASALRRYLRKWRGTDPEVIRKLPLLPDFPPPSPRQAAWWLCLDEERLEKTRKRICGGPDPAQP
jgi:hypothetical protein